MNSSVAHGNFDHAAGSRAVFSAHTPLRTRLVQPCHCLRSQGAPGPGFDLVQFYGCYGVRNELATTGAEAAKKIAEAKGNAKSTATRAQGKADANPFARR